MYLLTSVFVDKSATIEIPTFSQVKRQRPSDSSPPSFHVALQLLFQAGSERQGGSESLHSSGHGNLPKRNCEHWQNCSYRLRASHLCASLMEGKEKTGLSVPIILLRDHEGQTKIKAMERSNFIISERRYDSVIAPNCAVIFFPSDSISACCALFLGLLKAEVTSVVRGH